MIVLYISQNFQLNPKNSHKFLVISNLEYFQSSPDEVPMDIFRPFTTLVLPMWHHDMFSSLLSVHTEHLV